MLARNLEEGHAFLHREFSIGSLSVAWQVGSMGHSGLTPSLLSAFGFEFLVLDHINSAQHSKLAKDACLEFLWEGSDGASVLTHVLQSGYRTPAFLHPQQQGSCWTHKSTAVADW